MTTEIALFALKQLGCTITHPSCETVKMLAVAKTVKMVVVAIALHTIVRKKMEFSFVIPLVGID